MFGPQELSYKASASTPWEKWFVNKIGKNWKSPINYVDGQMHMRCLARELQRKTQLQVCIYWDGKKGNHSCALSRVQLESTGDYAAVNSKPADWWGSKPQNWANIGPKFRILLRDGYALSKIKDWKTYLPLKVNCTIVMVPAGEAFSGWASYPFDNMPGYPPRDGNMPAACYWGPCDATAGGPADAGVEPNDDLGVATSDPDEGMAHEGIAPLDAAAGAPDPPDAVAASGDRSGADLRGASGGCSVGDKAGGEAGGAGLLVALLGLLLGLQLGGRRRRCMN